MKENLHIQPEDTYTNSGDSSGTAERVIRRMVLECIPAMARWADNKDPLTRAMIQGTARKKSLYESGTNWAAVLEKFLGREIEIIKLAKPVDFSKLLTGVGLCSPLERMEALGPAKEDILIAAWHQDHGLLAITWPEIEDIPREISPVRWITTPLNREKAAIWAWDKRNFPNENLD